MLKPGVSLFQFLLVLTVASTLGKINNYNFTVKKHTQTSSLDSHFLTINLFPHSTSFLFLSFTLFLTPA